MARERTSPSNSVQFEVTTVPSSSGWADGEVDEEEDDNGADEFMERRLAEYSIVKTHRDRSPIQPTGVLEAMKQPMFSLHPPLPDPAQVAHTEPAAPLRKQEPYQDSVMERTCFIFSRKNRARIFAQQVVKAQWFEILIILLIFGNSAALAMYDPLEPDSVTTIALISREDLHRDLFGRNVLENRCARIHSRPCCIHPTHSRMPGNRL